MWDCPGCGCQAIAQSLGSCPMCRKERTMPKTTALGGGTNGVREPEAAPEAPEGPAPAPEPAPPAVTSTGSLALPAMGASSPPPEAAKA